MDDFKNLGKKTPNLLFKKASLNILKIEYTKGSLP